MNEAFTPGSEIAAANKSETEVFDQVWFEKLVDILGSDDTKDAFIPDKEQLESEKTSFLSGEVENPDLKYPNLDPEKLYRRDNQLLDLKKEILANESNETVKQLYRWRINEELAQVRMYKAALAGDSEKFDRYNRFIYGEPSPEIFNDTMATIRESLSEDLAAGDTELMASARSLWSALPESTQNEKLGEPDQVTFDAVKQAVLDDIAGFQIEIPNTKDKINAEQIVAAFTESLSKINATGWSVILDESSRRLITISQAKKEIYIPHTREVTSGRLASLTVHEILTHALRGAKGEQSALKLTAIGLDRYERGEEGAATARTQGYQNEEFDDYASMIDHMTIGLAQGLDGKPRDFREVFEILKKYHYYKNIKKGLAPDIAKEKAETSAWNTTRMNFRGSGYSKAGICNREKIMYREGNIELWSQLDKNPEAINRYIISLGKVDTANTRHLYALCQLKMITPEQLDEIEQTLSLND